MKESTHTPKGRISRYVKFMWCNENYAPETSKERVLPTGSSQLIINLDNKKFRHFKGPELREQLYNPAIITGIHLGHRFLDSYSRISTIGVVLKPGAINALFHIPADDCQDDVISLDSVLNVDISELRERLTDASTHQKKFFLMESFLLNLLDPAHRLHAAIDFAIGRIDDRNGALPVSEILNQTGYSRRWFSQIFRESVGISPKQYSRIRRFQHNLKLIRKSRSPDWAQLAISNGYFDQAHFIHDFKDLAGIPPSEYMKNKSDMVNHLTV